MNYSNIHLIPKYSELRSRSDASIAVEFLGRVWKAPWMPANMSSVINEDIAHWLSENGYFYIMHRFGDNKTLVERMNRENWQTKSISVGVKQADKDFVSTLTSDSVHFITIDIAHGHSSLVKEMIAFIKNALPKVKIIAGNVCTPEAVHDLTHWGADAAKVGIAGGAACSTKAQTGFHIPMFECVRDCYENGYKVNNEMGGIDSWMTERSIIPLIADGGIRENGDITKALVAGATMVMAGSVFAACKDAPGESIYPDFESDYELTLLHSELQRLKSMTGSASAHVYVETAQRFWKRQKELGPIKKRYYGSASAKQKGENKHVEGFEVELPCNGLTYEQKYQEMSESLRSAVSYAGGKDLSAFLNVSVVFE